MATQSNPQTSKKAGSRTAYQFACTDEDGTSSDCGYLQRNHDLQQLVRASQMHAIGLAPTRTEAERLIKSGAAEIDGVRTGMVFHAEPGTYTVRAGKRWKRIIVSE